MWVYLGEEANFKKVRFNERDLLVTEILKTSYN